MIPIKDKEEKQAPEKEAPGKTEKEAPEEEVKEAKQAAEEPAPEKEETPAEAPAEEKKPEEKAVSEEMALLNDKYLRICAEYDNYRKRTQKEKTRLIAGCGMLAAAAIVLQYLEFPLPFLIPPFIKFDFSDLPALIGAFAYGPLAGISIELVKNLIHLAASQSG